MAARQGAIWGGARTLLALPSFPPSTGLAGSEEEEEELGVKDCSCI